MKIKRNYDHVAQDKIVNEHGDGVSWIRGPLLGRGTFGRVHKASLRIKHQSKYKSCFPCEMAVKSAEVSVAGTLLVEREIMSNLKVCPYVIQCFGEETTMGYNGDLAYNILLEYGSGGSLADRIRKSGGNGLSEQEVKKHTRSILRGLKHINGMGYVHCDLKPGNILLVPNDTGKGGNIDSIEFRAKIGDFGLGQEAGLATLSEGYNYVFIARGCDR
ncbi:mitogen-activated protein kinase kinase kinase 3 [Phtheirospermum japonicum]|uniref:Mitogen-activated protein kinase kinase kinase 3 n=1 Tax=Phtheirospermum japonicum TaxID=374723 RepID=A0A830CEA9_9LAMI|nr:mitogen-activated protein kinase kinase kinase 3 [Phtheirospermum japonicum]